MNIHFIQHEAFEAPGAFLNWTEKHNYKVTFSKVYKNEPLPESTNNIDVLIILGGPQAPNTTIKECPHFNAMAEISFIQKCIFERKAVVGVCLGAQLIGQALGADYEHSTEIEIGVFPIRLTEAGLSDKKLQHCSSTMFVGHWHNDMPGLTPESKVLAISEGCPRQIIAYSNLVYGFQCHWEFTPEVVEMLIANDEEILQNRKISRFIQQPDDIRNYNYEEMNDNLFLFMEKLIDEYKRIKVVGQNICVLFDMDGVLIDTEPQYGAFWKGIAKEYNIDIDDFENKIKGVTIPHIIDSYFRKLTSKQIEDIMGKFVSFEKEVSFPDIPGATSFLSTLKSMGIKMALVTSSSELKLNRVLQQKHFDVIFDTIVSGKDIENSKPAPDYFLLGAERLNVPPECCVVFENSLAGIDAGNAAGMKVVGLSTTYPASDLIDRCVTVIPDFYSIKANLITSILNNEKEV